MSARQSVGRWLVTCADLIRGISALLGTSKCLSVKRGDGKSWLLGGWLGTWDKEAEKYRSALLGPNRRTLCSSAP